MFGLRTGKVGKLGVVGGARLAPSLLLDFVTGAPTSIADPRITFTRASTATFFDATGTMQTASANTPRFDFDPVTLAAKGLLIEEARTNLILNSATVSTQSITVTAQAYTLSFYGTGTITLSGAATGSLVGSGNFPLRATPLTFTPAAGTLTLTISGAVQNGQLEAGTFVTSYIPTTGSASTRAAGVASMPVGTWFNSSVGTLLVEGIYTGELSTSFTYLTGLVGANANTDDIGVLRFGSNGNASVAVRTGSTSISSAGVAVTLALGSVVKQAIAYVGRGTPTSAAAANGIASAYSSLSTPFTLPTITGLSIGGAISFQPTLTGYVRRVRFWPRALSNAELIAQTT